jgi:AcrR family transcriptional regulator
MARIGKEKKEAIKKEILDASRTMFFEQGYDKTSTNQIAKKVGVAEGTIFNYFKTKSDILIEVLTSEYADELERPDIDIISEGVVEIFMQFITKVTNKLLLLPKKMLLEIGTTIMNASRKKPGMIQKLAAYDFKYIDELEKVCIELVEKRVIKPCQTRWLAESIFSILMYEIMIYLYDKEMSKEAMYDRIEEKLTFEFEHRIEGE